jgi:hypothetical protein
MLQWLAVIGLTPALSACEGHESEDRSRPPWWEVPNDTVAPSPDDGADDEAMRALIDVLLPTEHDAGDGIFSPGALETGALEVLALRSFLPAARGLGFIRALPPELDAAIELGAPVFDRTLRAIVRQDLDALADDLAPGMRFVDLGAEKRRAAVAQGFRDPFRCTTLRYVRTVCVVSYFSRTSRPCGGPMAAM